MMCHISINLPSIEIDAINYHLTSSDFKQIIVTGKIHDPLSSAKMPENYHDRIGQAIHKSNSGFLAGCCFKEHPRRHAVTKQLAKSARKWVYSGFIELIYLVVGEDYQRFGLGTITMNRLKSYIKSENNKRREMSSKNQDITKILTYADNRAINFFKKNGF